MTAEGTHAPLHEHDLPERPESLFTAWYADARAAVRDDADAMTLATVGEDGRPSARTVLFKGLGGDGLRFFTNYESRKGRELAAQPVAALVFYWAALRRQVRVEGVVARVPDAESDAYWDARPMGSRLSALVSPQSRPVPDRAWLEERVRRATERWRHERVPRPPAWGGFRLTPDAWEFWSGGPHRLHDRFRYRRAASGWTRERLAP